MRETVDLLVLSLLVAYENRGCLYDDGAGTGAESETRELNERIRELQDISSVLDRRVLLAVAAFVLLPGTLLFLCYFAFSALAFPYPAYLVFTAACFLINGRGRVRVIDRVAKIVAGRLREWPDKRAAAVSRLESGAAFAHALVTVILCLQRIAAQS
ncbi:hypothetical protein [Desulfofundulus sp.]|uniref:hypothetical protein n=1 Tax=Desulfofundulus sp. TaxID=2282750 RepID=UPI003C737FFD